MSEKDIKRIEKKVDLLYRLKFDDRFNIKDNLDKFIPLFNLSIEMEETKELITEEELLKKQTKIKEELDRMKGYLNDDNISVKESIKLHQKLPKLIYQQEEKYKTLLKIIECYNGIKYKKEELYKELLMINLKEKLGIELSEEYDFRHKKTCEYKLNNAIADLEDWLIGYKEQFK